MFSAVYQELTILFSLSHWMKTVLICKGFMQYSNFAHVQFATLDGNLANESLIKTITCHHLLVYQCNMQKDYYKLWNVPGLLDYYISIL